jgi:DNA relaxase NicK
MNMPVKIDVMLNILLMIDDYIKLLYVIVDSLIQCLDLIRIHENHSGLVQHSLNVGNFINLKKINIVFDL